MIHDTTEHLTEANLISDLGRQSAAAVMAELASVSLRAKAAEVLPDAELRLTSLAHELEQADSEAEYAGELARQAGLALADAKKALERVLGSVSSALLDKENPHQVQLHQAYVEARSAAADAADRSGAKARLAKDKSGELVRLRRNVEHLRLIVAQQPETPVLQAAGLLAGRKK